MDKNSYIAVLNDLEKDKSILTDECKKLQAKYNEKSQQVSWVEGAINVIKLKLEKSVEIKSQIVRHDESNQSSITLGDGCERILKEAGDALHISRLVEELKKLGRFTTNHSLSSTLIKDSKKRFVLLGENIFDLRDRQQEKPFSLINAIREIVLEQNGKEFSPAIIFDSLLKRFPSEVNEDRRRSVNSTLNNLFAQGELERIRAGSFDEPPIYKATKQLRKVR